MNIKSTSCRNWAKSLKLYKIVQILAMFFDTSIIAENDLEYLVSLYTHTVYLSPQDQVRLTQQSYSSYL